MSVDPILKKLSAESPAEFVPQLISAYMEKGSAVVNFLYFANAMQYHLLREDDQAKTYVAYKEALLASDFLLPDGIALELWTKWTTGKKVSNLNGTDLTPQVFAYLNEYYKTSVYIYSLYDPKIGKGPERLERGVENLKKDYPHLNFRFCHQSLYSERGKDFPFDDLKAATETDTSAVRVFLNCTGSPFQECWTHEYSEFFQKNFFLVMNVGGFIDFAAGFEQRAPRRVVKMRVGETFWRIFTNPRKNLKKFLAMFGVVRLALRKLLLKK